MENLILCAMEKLKHSAIILSRSEIGKAHIYFHISLLFIHPHIYNIAAFSRFPLRNPIVRSPSSLLGSLVINHFAG